VRSVRLALNPVRHIHFLDRDELEKNPPTRLGYEQVDAAERRYVELPYLLGSGSNCAVWKGLGPHLPRKERWVKPKVKVTEMNSGTPKLSRTPSYVDGADGSSSPGPFNTTELPELCMYVG